MDRRSFLKKSGLLAFLPFVPIFVCKTKQIIPWEYTWEFVEEETITNTRWTLFKGNMLEYDRNIRDWRFMPSRMILDKSTGERLL